MKTPALALIAVVGLAGLAGCGGGGSSSSTSAADHKFAAAANALCAQDNRNINTVFPPQSRSDVGRFLDELAPLLAADLANLQRLQPASDQRRLYDAWIADLQRELALVNKAQSAARSSGGAAAKALIDGAPNLNAQADAKARQLGLDQCSSEVIHSKRWPGNVSGIG